MNKDTLLPNERIDDVNDRLRLIQKTDGLTFGTDALLLAAFIHKKERKALELGGGSGIISMLLAARKRFSKIACAEIQEDFFHLIRRNIALNALEDCIIPIHADVRDAHLLGECGEYDAVFSNPPYMTDFSGKACLSESKHIARHELFGSISDFAACASKMLRFGGSFYTVYRPDRLSELFSALSRYKLEPKRMTFVHTRTSLSPCVVLTEARLGGKTGLRVTRPLILSNGESNTDEYKYILENGIFPKEFL